MRTIASILITSLLLCTLLCCAKPEKQGKESEGKITNQSGRNTTVGGGGQNILVEPLPVEYLDEISTVGIDIGWEIIFIGLDRSLPAEEIWLQVVYNNNSGILKGNADYYAKDESYFWEFESNQPFLNIINYLRVHPDIFFDHSEFSGDPPYQGSYYGDGDPVETFALFVNGNFFDPDYYAYSIGKGTTTGEPAIPEIEFAIELIKSEIMDEVLLHQIN